MPTHLHLVLKQLRAHGISQYIGRLLNSYSRYFNKRYERKGPLWESRFQSLLVESDEQLLHLTRYLHLNPVTAGLVESPETWEYSSYREYLGLVSKEEGACNYSGLLEIGPLAYQRFVCNRIDYQRKLARIKNLLIEEKSPFLRQPRRLQPTRL
jgi:putative transposase